MQPFQIFAFMMLINLWAWRIESKLERIATALEKRNEKDGVE
jgi:hypothetical protein